MTSEKTSPDKYRLTLKALQLQTEGELSEPAPLERGLSARSTRGDASDPDRKEYRAKGAIRCLDLMGPANEEEI